MAALRRVRPPMSRWRTRAFRALVPVGARQWMRSKWQVVKSPSAWWVRLADPVWRWRHGQARRWEASVGRFFRGAWDATREVFERGNPRSSGYWKSKYGSLQGWEKSVISLVLGSWLVLASPLRSTFVPRIPDTVKYPNPKNDGSGSNVSDERVRPMSIYEQELREKAEEMASAIETFCADAPMMDLSDALSCLSPAENRIAEAFAILAKRMREEMPLNEDFIEGIDLVSEAHYDTAKMCEELPLSFEASHAPDIERVRNPRPGEERWDAAQNRG